MDVEGENFVLYFLHLQLLLFFTFIFKFHLFFFFFLNEWMWILGETENLKKKEQRFQFEGDHEPFGG